MAHVLIPDMLWQGGEDDVRRAFATGPDRSKYDAIVLCAEEFQPSSSSFRPGLVLIHAGFDDSALTADIVEKAVAASKIVSELVRGGKRVLVTCWAGRNRSGLVSALALRRVLGCTGAVACRAVQKRRPAALTNEHFARFLARIPAPLPRATPAPFAGPSATLV